MKKKSAVGAVCAAAVLAGCSGTVDTNTADVIVYGSTPAAITAAIAAKQGGASVIVVSPEKRIGGLTTGGLGQTDIGNKAAFGGLALQFYKDVAAYYLDDSHWKFQKRSEYSPDGQCMNSFGGGSMWTFEPHAALEILEAWEKKHGLDIRRGELLDRGPGGVAREKGAVVSFRTLSGAVYRGRVFVDATYEGDLMAAAGVTYHVGREANSVYGETLNGINRSSAIHHQFEKGVSAYVVPGDPKSGLLPFVEPDAAEPDGSGDGRVQAYCFRMCLTDHPANRIPFEKPEGYDPKNYELLFRNYEAQMKNHPEFAEQPGDWAGFPWINSKMPNCKTDTNNRLGFSTDFIGRNWKWAEGSYEEREAILKAHYDYQRGLMWALANEPRIPERFRREIARWGMCKDEFTDGLGGGWQRQLYVREARRMVGEYVMTEANCRRTASAPKPVAMAAYQMDSHHVRRYVDKDGFAHNEGDVEVGCPGPYPIGYGAIVPKRAECANLLVPVCVSASHIAFGSIRMEPVFFALGQAAGTAAAMAVAGGLAVQDVPYDGLRARLAAAGQVLELKNVEKKGE